MELLNFFTEYLFRKTSLEETAKKLLDALSSNIPPTVNPRAAQSNQSTCTPCWCQFSRKHDFSTFSQNISPKKLHRKNIVFSKLVRHQKELI